MMANKSLLLVPDSAPLPSFKMIALAILGHFAETLHVNGQHNCANAMCLNMLMSMCVVVTNSYTLLGLGDKNKAKCHSRAFIVSPITFIS